MIVPIEWLLRRALWRFFRTFHLLEIEGQQHLPANGPVIISCNHINHFDPFILQIAVPRRVHFIAWVRGFRHIFGMVMRMMGTIPIDLSRPDRQAYEAALAVLREGNILGIFPEGAFTSDGHVAHPKVGAARLAIESGAVLCPATLTGAFRVWAPQARGRKGVWGKLMPRPGKITLKFHPPVRLDPKERQTRARDKAYHRQVIEAAMAPVVRRVEPFLRAEERIEALVKSPASYIRIYEWLPLIALVIGAVLMQIRGVWEARLVASAALAYGAYFLYLWADLTWIPQQWWSKLVRNVIAPILLLLAMLPALMDIVARLRLSGWDATQTVTHWTWPFSGTFGRWLADWWTMTYLFPLVHAISSLWTYYFSHFIQFQKLIRGLILSFYLGLLLVIIYPPMGRAYPVGVSEDQWGFIARWFYSSQPGEGWQPLNFPGFFVLITVYLWLFDRRHQLTGRAAWYAPWVLNFLLATLFWRGLPWNEALIFILLAWLVIRYLGAVKFMAHDGRWV